MFNVECPFAGVGPISVHGTPEPLEQVQNEGHYILPGVLVEDERIPHRVLLREEKFMDKHHPILQQVLQKEIIGVDKNVPNFGVVEPLKMLEEHS